jgi:2-polyprenyl-3-methyl-5-hydroxy-6-metoxy-1,4-benzoquinol methylase
MLPLSAEEEVEMTASGTGTAEERRDALAGKLFSAAVESLDLLSVYLGDRLGLYRALADGGALTPVELAGAAGIHARYAREWLEQQAASGILDLESDSDDPDARRFRLPDGHDEALLDGGSLSYVAGLGQLLVALARPIHEVIEAYREGRGLPFEAYGADAFEGQAAMTRPLYLNLIGSEWFPAVADLHDRLQADPPARVADLACGGGISSIAIARAYPKVTVHGIDVDARSIELARTHLAGSGVEDRVEFHCRDAADPRLAGGYDLVTIFEALHDMSYPVEVLGASRGLLSEGGCVVVCDERTADRFEAPAGDVERLLYGASILHCLPVGMVGDGAAGTGTVMRADTVRRYAREAGFAGFEVLAIEHDFYRFYRLTP